jgi:hypothetical protein
MDVYRDFKDLLDALARESARYLVVGAHAVAFHSEPRYTKDLDIWIDSSPANARRVWRALVRFGAPLAGVDVRDLMNEETVYQIGVEPIRIDILAGLDGVRFDTAWRHRITSRFGGVPVQIIGKRELIRAKRAAGRPQDKLDVMRMLPVRRKRRRR